MNWEEENVKHTPKQRIKMFKEFRKEMGLTQNEIGNYLKTSPRTIQRWETRSAPPEALIQLIVIKDMLHDSIRKRSMRIKELKEQLEDLQFYTKTLEAQVEYLGGNPKESEPIDEEELEIMREVTEERCFGAEIKDLM